MKLADFGLARMYGSPEARYTSQVFARWYRAPELLFGATNYTWAVDIWAAGCVFAGAALGWECKVGCRMVFSTLFSISHTLWALKGGWCHGGGGGVQGT